MALGSEARHFAQLADAGFAVVQDRERFFCDGWIYNVPYRIDFLFPFSIDIDRRLEGESLQRF